MPGIVVPSYVLNLDLCTLVYQLYHQSLTLPLDPWFNVTARGGSDRRTNVCKLTHEYAKKLGTPSPSNTDPAKNYYSGPSAARGWTGGNLTLDPILTNYKKINPKLPMFTRDGGKFLAALAPSYISDNLKAIEFTRYTTKPTTFPAHNVETFEISDYPGSGEDHLIGFEGGTGVIGTADPAWSMMGFVLMRKNGDSFDCHVLFRGSRSGNAIGRTVIQAQGVIGTARGNSDWVTDLDSTSQVSDAWISKVGKMTKGFSLALRTMLGPIKASLKRLGMLFGAPPKNIYVSGHSLGAALATQFASACVLGQFGDELRKELPTWPWDQTHLVAYAQPVAGDHAWASAFNIFTNGQSLWVDGDMVVSGGSSGVANKLGVGGHHGGTNVRLPKISGCSDNPHETFIIRGALLRDATPIRPLPPAVATATPWAAYETFTKMLAGQQDSYLYPGAQAATIVTERNLRSVLVGCRFGREFNEWLEEVFAAMISDKSSYKGIHRQKTLDVRKKMVIQAVARMRALTPTANHAEALNNLSMDVDVMKDELGSSSEESFICLAMILDYYQKTTLTLSELNTKPNIKAILESKLNKA